MSIEDVENIVYEVLGVSKEDLIGKSRKQKIAWARIILCHHLRFSVFELTMDIGLLLNRSHSTIVSLEKSYDSYMTKNKKFIIFAKEVKRRIEEKGDLSND